MALIFYFNAMDILVISEHKPFSVTLAKRFFSKNFLVDIAQNGLDVLKKIMLRPYHAIVSGIRIPDIDGVELCTLLRKKFYSLPFLFVTHVKDVETKMRALEAGADDYLVHPFPYDDLAERIEALVRKKSLESPQKLSVRDVTLDISSHEVFRGDQKILLRKCEYQLLEFLMRHQNTVFTRPSLLEFVFGKQIHLSTPNTIDVHMLRLRRKLQYPKQAFIQTVHGMGYKVNGLEKR